MTVITTALIRRMRALRARGLTYLAVSVRVGVSPSTAWKYTWDVPSDSRSGRPPLPEETRRIMRRICESGCSAACAARAVGRHPATARKYCRDIIDRRKEEKKRKEDPERREASPDPSEEDHDKETPAPSA